jgi:hypothetical protein
MLCADKAAVATAILPCVVAVTSGAYTPEVVGDDSVTAVLIEGSKKLEVTGLLVDDTGPVWTWGIWLTVAVVFDKPTSASEIGLKTPMIVVKNWVVYVVNTTVTGELVVGAELNGAVDDEVVIAIRLTSVKRERVFFETDGGRRTPGTVATVS